MQAVLIITVALHVLSAVFWTGATFVLARVGAGSGRQLAAPMRGAAIVAILTGGYLWHLLHGSAFGPSEKVLMVGMVCALVAFAVQVTAGIRARRQLAGGVLTAEAVVTRMTTVSRLAAVLLAVTVMCMAAARFV